MFPYFSSPGHNGFLNDNSVTFIDKKDHSDPLKRENFCRQTLMIMTPYGLNTEDSVWVVPFDNIEVGTFCFAHILHFMDCFSRLELWKMNLFSHYFINFSFTFLYIFTSIVTIITLLLLLLLLLMLPILFSFLTCYLLLLLF